MKPRRTGPLALLALPLSAWLAACSAPPPPKRPPSVLQGRPASFRRSFLEGVLRRTCAPLAWVKSWEGGAMVDPIDGAAEEYLHLGARGLAMAHTKGGEEILLFDMGTPEGAYTMFLSMKDPGTSLASGLAASGGAPLGWKGRYLAQFPPSWGPARAKALLDLLPGTTQRPPLFDALPRAGLLGGSERILPQDPWGFGLFRWGLSGRYGSPPLTLFLLFPLEEPTRALAALQARLRSMDARIVPEGAGFRGLARGLGSFLFLPGKGKVLALTGIPKGVPPGKWKSLARSALAGPPLPPAPPWKEPSARPGIRRPGRPTESTPYTLVRVNREIGAILERFIEDPKEPLPTDDLSGPWRLQVRASFQAVECRPAGKGKGWDFFMKGKLGGHTWIHLERAGRFRFKGWIRAMGGKAGFQAATWPFSMTLSRDGSELNGKIRPPGRKGGMDLQLVRPVHVKNYKELDARLERLLSLREKLRKEGSQAKEKQP